MAALYLLCFLLLCQQGCAPPPPVAGRSGGPVLGEREEKAPMETRKDGPPPREKPAVAGLLASARQSARSGEYARAEMALERALRLEPRNAGLWHEMALVKYGGGDYGQAVQFALKSNSLAGGDSSLLRRNWLLLEKAYLKQGRQDKAGEARERARSLP